jgi:CDP-4-dehydro-6-deoxyglucose reductase
MAKLFSIALNGQTFTARAGDLLLDAALVNGVDMPHDCRAGRCGTCLTRVVKGRTICGDTNVKGMVHACQARVLSDLKLETEEVPEVRSVKATLMRVRNVARGIVELSIEPAGPLNYLAGQYYRFEFSGYPARSFSPTVPLDGPPRRGRVNLNVKQVRDGRVSPKLGVSIRPGHRLRVEGPFGHAFLREGQSGRLVLVAGGTGFAPMWSIAYAALKENPARPIVLIAGSRTIDALYVVPALTRISRFHNVTVIPVVEEPHGGPSFIRMGRPNDYLPVLKASDVVYAAGAPRMVDAVGSAAESAGATFYSDPFEPAAPASSARWLGRLRPA